MNYLLSKIYVNRLPIFLASALMNALNLPFILVVMIWGGYWGNQLSSTDMMMLLAVGLASGLFYVFWFYGCQHVKGSVAGLFTAFMPISTLCIAWLILGEAITAVQGLGMMMVVLSIVFNAKNQA